MSYETGQPIFKDYILKSYIGEGGFGRVYLVESPNGIRFALKVLHRGVEMEQRGVESVKGISSDYLVRVLDYGETVTGQPCILMEYYKDNLRSVVDAGKVDEERACRCFEHILKGLMVLERHGVMHRDIKPANLFIREENVKIGDFSTARYTTGDTSHKTDIIGTFHYMSPERFDEKYGHEVDRWSAAVVFCQLLTGGYPFKGQGRRQLFKAIESSEPDLEIVPEKYKGFLQKCFEKDKAQRYRNAEEMLSDFRAIESAKRRDLQIDNNGTFQFDKEEPSSKIESAFFLTKENPRQSIYSKIKESFNIKDTFFILICLILVYVMVDTVINLSPEHKQQILSFFSSEKTMKYRLTVVTKPIDARIRITNIDKNYEQGMMLEPGRFHVEVTRDGYKPYAEWVEIKENAMVRDIKMEPLQPEEKTYGLTVDPTPEDATIKIMNIVPKYHPGIQLEPGRYDILVEHNDYKTFREWIEINDQDRDLQIDLEKLPKPAFSSAPEIAPSESVTVKLRSKPVTTENKEDFTLKEVENDYVNNGDGTITDRTTGLMWEKSGSQNAMTYEKARNYINELNRKKFAGHAGWRLPTVEELWSLMEKTRMNGLLHIDPGFGNEQSYCRSSDKGSQGGTWFVDFDGGFIETHPLLDSYVRCVRSVPH